MRSSPGSNRGCWGTLLSAFLGVIGAVTDGASGSAFRMPEVTGSVPTDYPVTDVRRGSQMLAVSNGTGQHQSTRRKDATDGGTKPATGAVSDSPVKTPAKLAGPMVRKLPPVKSDPKR